MSNLKISKPAIGCTLYVLSALFSVMINIFAKKMFVQYSEPSWQVIFIRQAFVMGLLMPFMMKKQFNFFDRVAFWPNIQRGVLYVLSIFIMYTAIQHVAINTFVSIQFLVPVVASVMAIFIMKEKGTKILWIALFICTLGAFLTKRPSFENSNENFYLLLILLFVLIRSYVAVLNRKLAVRFDTATLVFYSNIIMFVISAAFFWEFVPVNSTVIAISAVCSIFYCLEYTFVFIANKFCSVISVQACEHILQGSARKDILLLEAQQLPGAFGVVGVKKFDDILRGVPAGQKEINFVALGGASLSDEQREEMTNREGVASGSATSFFVVI